MRGLTKIENIIMLMLKTGCDTEEHLNMSMTKFVKYLDTFYFNFNNYFLIIKILIKYFRKKLI